MNDSCQIDAWLDGRWWPIAEVRLDGDPLLGHARTPTQFSYVMDYAFENLGRTDVGAVSVRYPVDLADRRLESWPAFLLDLLPTGAGRNRLCERLGLPSGAAADWHLLSNCGGPPPGNLRVAAEQTSEAGSHTGFARKEVVDRADGFIGHCIELGYPIGGSSAVQGESPKVLLSEDTSGRFHPSGTLPPEQVAGEWLVKFPRGRSTVDREILRAEAVCYEVARRLGCRTGPPLVWEGDCLFVPRFDVTSQARKLQRLGLETIASALGKTAFGQAVSLDEFATAIREFSTTPDEDLMELLRRDILNVALGNTDNHSRNTAFLKSTGTVRLAPLYDFAPMMVDPEWIARACSWENDEDAGYPAWRAVAHTLAMDAMHEQHFVEQMAQLRQQLPEVPEWLREGGISETIVDRCRARCKRVTEDLS